MGLGTALIYSCAFYPLCHLSLTTTCKLMIQCRISSTVCFFVLNMIQVRISMMFTNRILRLGCVWRICLVWVFVVPLENFSLIWRRNHYRWLTYARHSWPLSSNGFFSMPLWHGAFVYNGHLRWHVTNTPGSVAVSTYFYDLGVSRLGF